MTTISTPHLLKTRLFHAGLAIAVLMQLGSSQFMTDKNGGNTPFWVHQYVGLAAFALVLGFWVVTIFRTRGTPLSEMVPWFNSTRRTAVVADLKTYIAAFKMRTVPTHTDPAPFASAIHGLGLLLMTLMVVTGSYYYFFNTTGPDEGGLVGLAMNLHRMSANLVWAYLVGHAGFAVMNHFAGTMSLSTMWFFKGDTK